MNFDQAFAKIIGYEGGYSNDMRDSGNWTTGRPGHPGELKGTKFGISAAAYPTLDIKNLTLEQAKDIYHADYWLAIRADELPEAIRLDMFDTAVNSGVKQAVKILQIALGVKDDGIIGPITLGSAQHCDANKLDKRVSAARLLYLVSLEKFPLYGRSWVRRVAQNLLDD